MIKQFTLLLLATINLSAQNGLISLQKEKISQGYTMIYPHNQPSVFLLNNCGEIVHRWDEANTSRPGNVAYLMNDGRLVKTKRPAAVAQDTIWAGGGGATISIVDWNNKELWSFTLNNGKHRLHHDISVMPNGNILAIAWENFSKKEIIDLGRDSLKIAQKSIWPDFIIEINPNENKIVWEWHAKDHFIQDFDASKPNYGVISEHPELIDLNYDNANGEASWMHTNAIDYNPELDQILISVPYFNEIWIIDHTTTSAEAATHKGGKSKKGGDLMYRLGNPKAYGRGTSDDQTLFFQHNAHWALDLPQNHPHRGKILVFNNRISSLYSAAEIIDAPWDMYTWSYGISDGVYLPKILDQTIIHPGPKSFSSEGLSSVQIMPNDNILLISGRQGYITELTADNEIVWEYVVPLKSGKPVDPNTVLMPGDNQTFRAYKYPIDYPAFLGKDLSPIGWIESNPDSTLCERLTSTTSIDFNTPISIYPNPTSDFIVIDDWVEEIYSVSIFNSMGAKIIESTSKPFKMIDVSSLPKGYYIVNVNSHMKRGFVKI